MDITVICIGKLKEKYWTDACAEYIKRLGKYCVLHIDELKESSLKDEGAGILKRIKSGDYVIALDIGGAEMDSIGLSAELKRLAVSGNSRVDFIIGGSDGLSGEVKARADLRLSFSKMTFPHQMMRVILLEQIYRGFKIIRNEKYHK